MEEGTFLERFIGQKINDYVEPERTGVPKGSPIGLSTRKYRAALMGLTKCPLKEIATAVGVSYGLLRKWRTEDQFLEVPFTEADEFAAEFEKHLKERVDIQDRMLADYLKQPLEKIIETPVLALSWKGFCDIQIYGNLLLLRLVGKIHEIGKRVTRKVDKATLLDHIKVFYEAMNFQNIVLSAVLTSSKGEYLKRLENNFRESEALHLDLQHSATLALLKQRPLSEEHQKLLVVHAHKQAGFVNYVDV